MLRMCRHRHHDLPETAGKLEEEVLLIERRKKIEMYPPPPDKHNVKRYSDGIRKVDNSKINIVALRSVCTEKPNQ